MYPLAITVVEKNDLLTSWKEDDLVCVSLVTKSYETLTREVI